MSRLGKAALLAAAFAGCASQPRLKPYTSDGCSLFPDGTSKNKVLWLHCCQAHDYRYWMGGTDHERLTADYELRACMTDAGKPTVGALMFRGTRAGGTPYLPSSFRWGYGWPYLRGYKPLSVGEKKLIVEAIRR